MGKLLDDYNAEMRRREVLERALLGRIVVSPEVSAAMRRDDAAQATRKAAKIEKKRQAKERRRRERRADVGAQLRGEIWRIQRAGMDRINREP